MALPFTEAPSLIAAKIISGLKLLLTAIHVISLWANSLPLRGLARTSSHKRRCVGLKSCWTYRTTIARASPSRAVPSNMMEASLTMLSSAFNFSFSLSKITGIRSFMWLFEVNLCPYFSKRGRKMSTFEIPVGIPAKRRVSTTSKRKSLRLAGNVVPLAFSCLSCLCKHWKMVWLSFLSAVIRAIPARCFFDFICLSTVLFFWASISWQALHFNCPRTYS